MPLMLKFVLEYFLLSSLILIVVFLCAPRIKSRWPNWWETWVAAPYPEELAIADYYHWKSYVGRKQSPARSDIRSLTEGVEGI